MRARRSIITVTDQFCGAGGSSIGVTHAGAELRLALNHWRLAVETHNSNFPNAAHDCVDISACDPRRYQPTDILITSPECTNHSLAKGAERIKQDRLFDNGPIDPSAERSRATMWDVPRFAERHNYRLIIVENVVDARKWRLFDAWLHAMHLLDYQHKIVYFNSMFAPAPPHGVGVPQSRDRMYVVFWQRANRAPDLDFRPPAFCERCAEPVAAIQSWKRGEYPWGRYGARRQYLYRCPHCAGAVTPRYWPAWTAIDWTLPVERIGDRKRPLKPNTMRRIGAGLRKFGRIPVAVALDHSQGDSTKTYSVADPMPTQTTRQTLGLAVPFLAVLRGTETGHPITDPFTTIVACASQHWLVAPAGVTCADGAAMPFLASYYNGCAAVHPVTDPMGAVTTVDRHALVVPQLPASEDLRVEDCGFRMIVPREIKRAMAFPDEYILLGGQREQVRLLGNAVTPPVMTMIFQRCVETLK